MKLLKSFKHALAGLWSAVRNEMNFRIHTVAAISVIMFAAVYGVDKLQAAVLTLVICLVLIAELFNTSLEAIVDILCPQKSEIAKIAKDSAAAAVLAMASGAVIVAVFIFSDVEKLKRVLEFAIDNIIFFICYIAACTYYIFGIKSAKNKRK